MDFGRAIRICRAAFGLRQSDLADRIDIGKSHLSLIESGKRKPSLGTLEKIASAFDMPVHLMMILAAEDDDLKAGSEESVEELGQALLKLLVAASNKDGQLLLDI